jgi:hypothetical protein
MCVLHRGAPRGLLWYPAAGCVVGVGYVYCFGEALLCPVCLVLGMCMCGGVGESYVVLCRRGRLGWFLVFCKILLRGIGESVV